MSGASTATHHTQSLLQRRPLVSDRFEIEERSYKGRLANVSLDAGLHGNPTKQIQRYPTLPPPTLKRYLNNQECWEIFIVSVEHGRCGGLVQGEQEGLPYVRLLTSTIQGHCFGGVGEPLLQDFPGRRRVRFCHY